MIDLAAIDRSSAYVARRLLARDLAQIREDAGLRQADAVRALRGISRAKLQYLESGERPIADDDLAAMLDLYGCQPEERTRLAELAEHSRQRGWWDHYADAELSPGAKRYTALEWGSKTIRIWSGSLIPPLLQLPEYAAALFHLGHQRSPEQVQRFLEVRHQRAAALDADDPLTYRAVLDEATLQRFDADSSTKAAQLRHVADRVETLEHVDVRVVPFAAGLYAGTVPRFTILDFGVPGDPGLVHTEPGLAGTTYYDDINDVFGFSAAFERLSTLALSRTETLELLRNLASSVR